MEPAEKKILEEASNQIDDSISRVDLLLSAYLDDELDEAEMDELNGIFSEDEEARSHCVKTLTLHSDLLAYFGTSAEAQ